MLTSPSNREAMAEPRSLRKRDSHTRQYCSPHSPRLHHGAWNEPGRQQLCFNVRKRLSSTCKWSVFWAIVCEGATKLVTECIFLWGKRAAWFYVKPKLKWFVCILSCGHSAGIVSENYVQTFAQYYHSQQMIFLNCGIPVDQRGESRVFKIKAPRYKQELVGWHWSSLLQ